MLTLPSGQDTTFYPHGTLRLRIKVAFSHGILRLWIRVAFSHGILRLRIRVAFFSLTEMTMDMVVWCKKDRIE